MDLTWNADQVQIVTGIDQFLARFKDGPEIGSIAYFARSAALEQELVDGGFLDIAREESMGPLEATALIEAVSALAFSTEVAASGLVAPMLGIEPGGYPLALAQASLARRPVRFAAEAAALLVDCGDAVRLIARGDYDVIATEGPFAYPTAIVTMVDLSTHQVLEGASPHELRQWWRIGLCFEIIGAAQSAFDLTVQYVKDRKQFGHPLGDFQAIQHRLAECAALLNGGRWMARKAAASRDATEASMAAAYCQELAARLAYDTQQFHGAIGLTLEYPLHLWTYRLRLLQGELQGAPGQYADAAVGMWESTRPLAPRVDSRFGD